MSKDKVLTDKYVEQDDSRNIGIGMQTKLLSDLVEQHGKKIGFFKPDEQVKVISVDVTGKTSEVEVKIFTGEDND